MARIDIKSGGTILNDGILQLENGVAMDATLRNVADQNNTTSPLKLSTTAVQVVSPLRITTDDPSDMYLDCEDGATNNRFNITRNTASQQVNLNFASNPAGSTTIVGAIRTYVDGVNLSEVMAFREDGNVGIGTTTPTNAVSIERTTGNAVLSLQGNAGTFISISRFSNNSTRPRLELYKSRGTISTPAVIQTNDELGSVDFYGYDGSANQRVGILLVNAESVVGSTITPQMAFGLGTSAASTTYKMVVKNDGNVTIGNELNTLGARLGIKGSGSTSATTSLLVQNSGGTTSLQVTDDRTTFVNGLLNVGTQYTGLSFSGANCNIFNNGGSSGVISLSMGGNTYLQIYQPKDGNSGITSGTINTITTPIGYGWSSGSASPNLLSLNPSINNTGTYSGTFRGIYYNPTLTSLTGTTHYGIQTTSGGAYINTTTPQGSACLQADSTTQGFLPPRMTNAQRAAITTPAIGLMVYCTDAVEGLYVYKSTGWTFVI